MPDVQWHEIPSVVDLRQPETRQSFFEVFRTGVQQTMDEVELDGGTYYRMGGDNISRFEEMIPELVDPHLGGTDAGNEGLTQAIGDYLRAKGVSGLIYPSARTDSYVEFKNAQMARFGGWNFVDFRGSKRKPHIRNFVMVGPWSQRVMGGVEVQAPDKGDFAGSPCRSEA